MALERTLLKLRQVEAATGWKKSKIYQEIKKGNFPVPVRLGPRSVAWISHEIQGWIDERPRADDLRC